MTNESIVIRAPLWNISRRRGRSESRSRSRSRERLARKLQGLCHCYCLVALPFIKQLSGSRQGSTERSLIYARSERFLGLGKARYICTQFHTGKSGQRDGQIVTQPGFSSVNLELRTALE